MASTSQNTDAASSQSSRINLRILSPSPNVSRMSFPSVALSITVGELKEKIRDAVEGHPPPDQQRLIYQGRPLSRNEDTLQSVLRPDPNQKEDITFTLHLVLSPPVSSSTAANEYRQPRQPRHQVPSNIPFRLPDGMPTTMRPPQVFGSVPTHHPQPPFNVTVQAVQTVQTVQHDGVAPGPSIAHPVPAFPTAPVPLSEQFDVLQQQAMIGQLQRRIQGQLMSILFPGSTSTDILPPQTHVNYPNQQGSQQPQLATALPSQNLTNTDHISSIPTSASSSSERIPRTSPSPPTEQRSHSQPNIQQAHTITEHIRYSIPAQDVPSVMPQLFGNPSQGTYPMPSVSNGLLSTGAGATFRMNQLIQRDARRNLLDLEQIMATFETLMAHGRVPLFADLQMYISLLQRATMDLRLDDAFFQGRLARLSDRTMTLRDYYLTPSRTVITPSVYLVSSPSGPQGLVFLPSGVYSGNFNGQPLVPDIQLPVQQIPIAQNDLVGGNINQVPNQLIQNAQVQGQNPVAANPARGIALLRFAWLFVRLFGFILFFTSGAGLRQTIIIHLVAFVILIAQTGIFAPLRDNILGPIRRHLDNLIPVDGDVVQNNEGGAQNQDGNRNAAPAEPANPQQMADRLVRETNQRQFGWFRRYLVWLERAVALFIASLVPGIGERHIAAREAAEARRRQQAREVEERDRQANQDREENAVEADVPNQENNAGRPEVEVPGNAN